MELELIRHGASGPHESPESPQWEVTDGKVTCTRTFAGWYEECLLNWPWVGSWSVNGITAGLKVTNVTCNKTRGGNGELVVKYEGILLVGGLPAQALPIDEAGIETQQQEFPLERHPNYAGLTPELLAKVKAYVDAKKVQDRIENGGAVSANPVAWELAQKMLNGETHFVLWVPVYQWTSYSWAQPALFVGGIIQAPFGPAAYPAGYQWLRQGDKTNCNGQHWALTRTWIAAPQWDADIYG